MPFYEYECSACKYYLEVLQKITDTPMTKCPSCGKEELHRLISAPVFRLKGSGWYETDFKSDKENKRNLAEDKEPAKADNDDKVKVRASKALKKAAGQKPGRKAGTKAAKKASKRGASTKAKSQPAKKKVTAKPAKKLARKVAKAAKKSVAKPARKVAKKTTKKTTKKTAKKK
jgi:putative FmdB family regulatory protein